MSLRIAITGNIASGKSQVELILKEAGFKVFDADLIAHEVLDEINSFNGYDVFTDGKIDRKKLGDLVFSNKDIKSELEKIVHPIIKSRIIDIFNSYSNEAFIFVSVPLLYEAGFEDIFDKVLLVTVPEQVQLERLMQRNDLTKEKALLRINSQLSQNLKLKKADYVISNDSSIEGLKSKVNDFIRKIIKIQN